MIREESLNVTLAELLAEKGLIALGETILRRMGGGLRPDVLIELNGVRICVEGKRLGAWSELVKQCEGRLDNNYCDLCVMIEYTEVKLVKLMPSQLDVKNALLKGKFNVGFMSYIDRAGLDKWINVKREYEKYTNVSFDELLTYLISAYDRVVKEDIVGRVVEEMREVLNEFAIRVSSIGVNVKRLKQVLELRESGVEFDER